MKKSNPKLDTDQLNLLIEKSGALESLNLFYNFEKLVGDMDIDDIKSVGTKNGTLLARKFENVFHDAFTDQEKQKLPCFWSCRPGKIMAEKHTNFFTDADILIFRMLFTYCEIIRTLTGHHTIYMTELSFAISRMFARSAGAPWFDGQKKIIYVFMGSDKRSEATGFHIGNNFWSAELPILQEMLWEGKIDGLKLVILDADGNISKNIDVATDHVDIPLWRRTWHHMDSEQSKKSFVDGLIHQHEWDAWRLEPPRPSLTYARMKYFIAKWRNIINKT